MTVVTDYAIVVVCGWFAARLIFSERHRQHLSRQAWAIGFLLIGIGLIVGGTGHGFALYLSDSAMIMIWKLAYYAAGLSMASIVAGSVIGSVSAGRGQRVLHSLNALVLVIFAAWVTISDDNFLWVIIDSVISLAAIALIQAWAFVTQKSRSAMWLIAGVLVYILSAVIQQSDLDLHQHFNHNDLYHVVLMIGLYLLYRGVELMQDQKRTSTIEISGQPI